MVRKAPSSTAARLVPPSRSLADLAAAARGCRACDLWRRATQTVFGEGLAHAPLFFVGEQPGDREDRAGQPFVGPAGQLLDRALAEAGIDRKAAYVTNTVKHFKSETRGKRRIHQKPDAIEIAACLPWLEAEIEAVQPDLIICLGATAAQALIGKDFRVTKQRGDVFSSRFGPRITATIHPSSILRAPDETSRQEAFGSLVDDLKRIGALVGASFARPRT